MTGRAFPTEDDLIARGYGRADLVRRRAILAETLHKFQTADPPDRYDKLAAANLARWKSETAAEIPVGQVQVLSGDWGEVTRSLTRKYGVCFAVLNMANAFVPGGAYVEGAIAQEENMFRRTDCHFHVRADEYDASLDRYLRHMTRLISAVDGVIYLDIDHPRVCIRGPEDRTRQDLGYPWLADDEVFPFFELRAAAQDLRGGASFDTVEARRRIAAQLDTLRQRRIRHAVLSAFGCGAFGNPARDVARLYREEIDRRLCDFALVAFAIYAAGYGPDNCTPFLEEFGFNSENAEFARHLTGGDIAFSEH